MKLKLLIVNYNFRMKIFRFVVVIEFSKIRSVTIEAFVIKAFNAWMPKASDQKLPIRKKIFESPS